MPISVTLLEYASFSPNICHTKIVIETKVADEVCGSQIMTVKITYCFRDVMPCSLVDISKVLEDSVVYTFRVVEFRYKQV
jgi:hypothetical protein